MGAATRSLQAPLTGRQRSTLELRTEPGKIVVQAALVALAVPFMIAYVTFSIARVAGRIPLGGARRRQVARGRRDLWRAFARGAADPRLRWRRGARRRMSFPAATGSIRRSGHAARAGAGPINHQQRTGI